MNVIEVVCAVMENEAGQVWIGKRSSDVADGKWEFPGGKVEQGETSKQALVREIKEELNLDIEVQDYITEVFDRAFDPVVHIRAYRAQILHGTMELHAHSEGVWIAPEDVFSYDFMEADQVLLHALQRK